MLKATALVALTAAVSVVEASPIEQPKTIKLNLPRASTDIQEGTQADLKTLLGRTHTGFSLKFAQDAITYFNNTGNAFRFADLDKAHDHVKLVNLLNTTNVTLPGTKRTSKAASGSHYVESNFTTNINVPAVRVSSKSAVSKRVVVSQKSLETGADNQAQTYDTEIGNPAQIVSADYFTTSGDIAVPATWIGVGHAWTYIPDQAYYDPRQSKTGTNTFEPVIIGDFYDSYSVWGQGTIWSDTVGFGGAKVTYPFAVLNYQESQWYGGVGLAYPSLSKTLIHRFTADPFVVALRKAGAISHSEFYVNTFVPELTLGGYAGKNFHWVSNEVSFQGAYENLALSYSYWTTSKIALYNGNIGSGTFGNAVLDNSAIMSKLPLAQASLFFSGSGIIPLFLELPINFVQDFTHAVQPVPITILETVAVWVYACDSKAGGEKYFDFDGVKIPFTLRDIAAYKVGDLCIAGVYSTVLGGLVVDDGLSIIGRIFFDRGIVGFNFDANSIGFAAH